MLNLNDILGSSSAAISAFNSPQNPFWDGNDGISDMRVIAKETAIFANDTQEVAQKKKEERITRAREAFGKIEIAFEQLKMSMAAANKMPGVNGKLGKQTAMIDSFFKMTARMRKDWRYANMVFFNFPKIADTYGCGNQLQTGKPRIPVSPQSLMSDQLFLQIIGKAKWS